jgi:hypothetical protein
VRLVIVAVLGLFTGLMTGLVLSEIIGIIGYLVTGDAIGIRFLPIYLGAAFAGLAPFVDRRRASRFAR